MYEIPLDKEINRFATHLKNNPRIIFSAKFGDGKSHFFKRFKEAKKENIRMITIYPLNYCVSKNEDIFEYIKRDILLQLKDDGIMESIDLDAFEKSLFSTENVLEVIGFLISALPYGDMVTKLLEKAAKIKSDYDEKRKDSVDEYISKFSLKTGNIYERDAFTTLIELLVDRIKSNEKRTILLIEDLDRIDPQHVFRILNILGAHIDEDEESNKFGFDNIIVVLDYEITKHIFHHFYGADANYSGYMSKFVSHYPYKYSITRLAQNYLYEILESKCGLSRNVISEFNIKQTPYFETLSSVISRKSVRDIVKVLDGLEHQYDSCTFQIRRNICIKSDAPIVIFLAILKRLQCDVTDHILVRSIRLIKGVEGLNLIGDYMLTNSAIVNGVYFMNNNESFAAELNTFGELTTCSFHRSHGGVNLHGDIDNIMSQAISEAKRFVYDL